MCTVTVLRIIDADEMAVVAGGMRGDSECSWIRIACNRDESRLRPPAHPPQLRQIGDRNVVMPIDPVSDGTWIAVNDAGLAMTLLNANAKRIATKSSAVNPDDLRSRGEIIPHLMKYFDVASAEAAAHQIQINHYAPFRLVILDRYAVVDLQSDGQSIRVGRAGLTDEPLMFTSSGLGDELVELPRRALFREVFSQSGDRILQQEQFHRHRWPERSHLSVCMNREDACTVSYAVVELRLDRALVKYHPTPPDQPADDFSLSFVRRATP